MSGYSRTRMAAQMLGLDSGQVLTAEQRRLVRDQARQINGGTLPSAVKRRDLRLERKRAVFAERIAAAATPGQQMSAAASYLASALAEVPAHRADQVAAATVQHLQSLAEQILKEARA
jgi:hypothetical protein